MVHHAADGSFGLNATVDSGLSPEELEAGRLLFARECEFVAAANQLASLPEPELPEVAFSGRSNVGKSSLINALTGRRALARTSNTPGRTQQLNFFRLGGRLMLVDLPGYGYARASKAQVAAWTRLVESFLKGRPGLRRTCVLIDSRHGLKDVDRQMLDMLDQAAVSYQVVLTKADKLKPVELDRTLRSVADALERRVAAHPRVLATSAETGTGIAELRAELAGIAVPH